VLLPVTKNVFCYAATVLTSVLYVHVLKLEAPSLVKTYTLSVLKFVKHVLLSVQNTLHIMLLVRSVLRLVKNVLQFVKNLQRQKHNYR